MAEETPAEEAGDTIAAEEMQEPLSAKNAGRRKQAGYRSAAAAAARKRQVRKRAFLAGGVALLAVLVLGVLIARSGDGGSSIQQLKTFRGLSREHVETPVIYAEVPPVGGNHSAVPETCGPYFQPIPSERAVHSMEHGAVWITHQPFMPRSEIEKLWAIARREPKILISPLPGQETPVVASAWERQLPLLAVDDPRLAKFIEAFRDGPQAPERGGPCVGEGTPLPEPVDGKQGFSRP